MKSQSTFLIILLTLTTLGGIAWCWNQHQELVALRADTLNRGDTDLQKRLADAQKRIKALSDQVAALRGQSGTAADHAASPDSNAPNDAGAQRAQNGFVAIRSLMNNPQFMKLATIQEKAMLDGAYAALFKNLNLTPQQLEQFKNLLVQKQQAIIDAQMAAQQQGLTPRTDPQGYQTALSQAAAAADQQIQAAMGDAVFSQYQQYQQTLPQRNTVNQLQQSLSYTPTPLTDDQTSQLIQILAQNAPQRNAAAGGTGGVESGLGGGGGVGGVGAVQPASITPQAVTQAQGLLSAPQLQALQQLQQQQQEQQQLLQMIRATGGGRG